MAEYQNLVIAGVLLVTAMGIFVFLKVQESRRKKERKLQELLDNTDELTQINNSKYIDDMLDKELDRSRRYGTAFSFIIIELDNYPGLKDEYGQQFSRRVLKETAENLQEKIRAYDVLSRDEHRFLCLFPQTGMESTLLLAKRARATVAAETYNFKVGGDPIHVTASIGATSCDPGSDKNITIDTIKETANRALDYAKAKGANSLEYIETASN